MRSRFFLKQQCCDSTSGLNLVVVSSITIKSNLAQCLKNIFYNKYVSYCKLNMTEIYSANKTPSSLKAIDQFNRNSKLPIIIFTSAPCNLSTFKTNLCSALLNLGGQLPRANRIIAGLISIRYISWLTYLRRATITESNGHFWQCPKRFPRISTLFC